MHHSFAFPIFRRFTSPPPLPPIAYGRPPIEVEAVGHNQGATVWWKAPPLARGGGEIREGSQSGAENDNANTNANTTTNSRRGRTKNGDTRNGVCKGEGRGGSGGRGGGGDRGGGGGGIGVGDEGAGPKAVGFVVYRYRLDGREWNKKGGTEVNGSSTLSCRVKGLKNGVVYR